MRIPKPPKREAREPKPLRRGKKPRARRKGVRAKLAREVAALWSAKVRVKNEGRCVMAGYDEVRCWSVIDAAHDFPKGADPAVRYDVEFGEPVCRGHHRRYGNGERWRWFLFKLWGPALYAERYGLAHRAGRKLDLAEVKRELSA